MVWAIFLRCESAVPGLSDIGSFRRHSVCASREIAAEVEEVLVSAGIGLEYVCLPYVARGAVPDRLTDGMVRREFPN